jgi:hypothetical protein
MPASTSSKAALTLDEKRQLIFASLLRYAPETAPLRDRALDQLVAGALLGSSENEPFRIGKISASLVFGSDAPIRVGVIQESLERLIAVDKVRRTELNSRHAYHLTPGATEEMGRLVRSTEDLFKPVFDQLLANT